MHHPACFPLLTHTWRVRLPDLCFCPKPYLLVQVCWDFYHAAKQGFIALAEATSVLYGPCPDTDYNVRRLGKGVIGLQNLPGPEQLGGWSFWDTAVQRPTQLKLPQLKDAARYFGLQV